MNSNEFDRSKIYEKLDYQPEPAGYSGKIPWKIQQQISATNGIHYEYEIGALNDYPIPEIPIAKASTPNEIILDIGCGWGRWLIAAGKKQYIPIGADLRLEFCNVSREAMRENGINGYAVVADLKNLPFCDNIFKVVWSFSVIQHTHKERMLSCLKHIHRILKYGGFTKLEFPNKAGLRNRIGPVKEFTKYADDYNSWCVRYYTVGEYRKIFQSNFGNFDFSNHSFLGIGVLPNDLKYIKNFKNRMGVAVSLSLSVLTKVIPGLKYFSDSIYITAVKKVKNEVNQSVSEFLKLHSANPTNNLNIIPLLRCPKTNGELVLDQSNTYLISTIGQIKYPIKNEIPILIESEAVSL